MSNSTPIDILCALRKVDRAVIVGHSHPDGDCVGSACALAFLLCAMGKSAKVIFPEKVPLRLEFITEGVDVIESLPEDMSDYTVICTDVASPSQLGTLAEALNGKIALRIDHHGVSTSFAETELVRPEAAAAGEIIFDICEAAVAQNDIAEIPDRALFAVYAAISSDTGCFKYSNVTPETHLRAAKLVGAKIPCARINLLLFDTKDPSQIRAEGIVQNRLRIVENGKISAVIIEKSDYANGLAMSDFETAVDIARSPRGVKAAVVLKAADGGAYRVSLRGNGDTAVADVAAAFGGGGHRCAAGCTVYANSGEEAFEKVLSVLKQQLF